MRMIHWPNKIWCVGSHLCWPILRCTGIALQTDMGVIGVLKNKYPTLVNIKKASGTDLNIPILTIDKRQQYRDVICIKALNKTVLEKQKENHHQTSAKRPIWERPNCNCSPYLTSEVDWLHIVLCQPTRPSKYLTILSDPFISDPFLPK